MRPDPSMSSRYFMVPGREKMGPKLPMASLIPHRGERSNQRAGNFVEEHFSGKSQHEATFFHFGQ
ncbi:MAG: hypothetical protein ACXVCK_11130, partial [Bdellovibrionota bacterium]